MCTEFVELDATKTPLNFAIWKESYMRWFLISFHYEENLIAVPSGASSLLIVRLIQLRRLTLLQCMRSFA